MLSHHVLIMVVNQYLKELAIKLVAVAGGVALLVWMIQLIA